MSSAWRHLAPDRGEAEGAGAGRARGLPAPDAGEAESAGAGSAGRLAAPDGRVGEVAGARLSIVAPPRSAGLSVASRWRGLAADLRRVALGHGAAAFGICTSDPFPETAHELDRRMADGSHAGLTFTYRNPAVATDVRRSYPWAERLVVLAWSYLPEAGSPGPPETGTGRIARFATRDHYEGLRKALDATASLLETSGHRTAVLCDDERLVDRAAAVRAGVGWWGKNTMVLAPGDGPWLLLGSVATDADLETSQPMERTCGSCSACIPACPTGALVAPGLLDARLCLARWAQAKGDLPRGIRRQMGDRIYGCDDCLDACPPGKRLVRRATDRLGRVDLRELLEASDEHLRERYRHWYMPKTDPVVIRRNALVALGNTGGESAVPVLIRHLSHRRPVLRRHAAWGLGEIGSPQAVGALQAALDVERDRSVRAEIDHALGVAAQAATAGHDAALR